MTVAGPALGADRRFLALLGLLGLVALVPTLLGIPGRWLWYDEILSVVWSMNGPWATLMTALRFDVHPPLYYMQLTLWMLLGQGDAWLMLNPALWHAAAVVLLGWTAARRYGRAVGLGAALLLAISPAALAYADNVRMYTFIMALIVWAWDAQGRWLEGRAGRFGWLWLVLSQVMITNSHTAGLLMLSGVVALGAGSLAASGQWRRLPTWLGLEVMVLALSVLPLGIGATRGVSHLDAPDAGEIWAVWVFLAGGQGMPGLIALAIALAVIAGLAAGALRQRRQGLEAAALILLPMLVIAGLSHLLRPIWIERLFVPVIPFLCLALARAALSAPAPGLAAPRAGLGLLVALALTWGVVAATVQVPRPKGDGYRPVAEAVRAAARPGDTVLVAGDFHFWCFLWYFAGPGWGDARQAYLMTPAWDRIGARAGRIIRMLGMGSAHTTRMAGGVRVELWDPATLPPPRPEGEIFLLRMRASASVPVPGRVLAESTEHTQFVLERWAPSGQ
jgi:hypothetical protein